MTPAITILKCIRITQSEKPLDLWYHVKTGHKTPKVSHDRGFIELCILTTLLVRALLAAGQPTEPAHSIMADSEGNSTPQEEITTVVRKRKEKVKVKVKRRKEKEPREDGQNVSSSLRITVDEEHNNNIGSVKRIFELSFTMCRVISYIISIEYNAVSVLSVTSAKRIESCSIVILRTQMTLYYSNTTFHQVRHIKSCMQMQKGCDLYSCLHSHALGD